MNGLLREQFLDIYKSFFTTPFNPLEYYLINVLSFYKITNFLLASKSKNITYNKFRPILIVAVNNDSVEFVAFSTDENYAKKRPVIKLEFSELYRSINDLPIKIQTECWLFGKKTNSKKMRFIYDANVHNLLAMQNKGDLILCAKCNPNMLKKINDSIEAYANTR